MRNCKTLLAAVVLAGAVLAAPGTPVARGKGGALVDYDKLREVMPDMKALASRGNDLGKSLHPLMERLKESDNEEEQVEIRLELKKQLEDYMQTKAELVPICKSVLGIKSSSTKLSDQEIFERLQETELVDIYWNNRSFKRCLRDISRAIKVPIRMQFRVVQRNTIENQFKKLSAATVLGWLCSGLDLRYVIYDGEIIVYKQITPTEARFLSYQERHPEVELRYWDREDASGEIKEKK